MSEKRDYYEILSVARDADGATIKKAYRRLAVEFHPDRNPGNAKAEEQFKEAAEAYQVLSDPERRASYDRFGHSGARGAGGFSDASDIFSAFGDIFGDLFGGRGGGGRQARGADLETVVELTLVEASEGVSRDLEIVRQTSCEPCGGSGATPGTQPKKCGTCRGSGQVVHSQGFLMISTACPRCRGAGEVIEDPCKECRGTGHVGIKDKLQVQIPAGVDDGSTLRLTGRGEAGPRGARPGNLYVHVRVKPDERFEREGANLHSVLSISFAQAALGATLSVDTLTGKEEIDVKPGTQPGEEIVLRGRGLPEINGPRTGDIIIHCKVVVPTKLSKEEEQHLRAFAAAGSGGPVKQGKGGLFGRKK
jgi:molecular chaperone DnaJ